MRSDNQQITPAAVHGIGVGSLHKISVKKRGWLRRLAAFVGPAYLVSVGYMDPGNWATDIEGGARFGYQLIWVLFMSNIMAVLLQTLSARMGIVTGHDLAQGCRREYSRSVVMCLWLLAEIAIAATDLAEALGTIVGLNLRPAQRAPAYNGYTGGSGIEYQRSQLPNVSWEMIIGNNFKNILCQ